MRGILADANVEKHLRLIVQLFRAASREELWTALRMDAFTLADLGLDSKTADRVLWQRCQAKGLVLFTANRNKQGRDSLEETIRTLNQSDSLPVLTIADARRLLDDAAYREQVADRCLEYLYDVDNLRGTGRIFVP